MALRIPTVALDGVCVLLCALQRSPSPKNFYAIAAADRLKCNAVAQCLLIRQRWFRLDRTSGTGFKLCWLFEVLMTAKTKDGTRNRELDLLVN